MSAFGGLLLTLSALSPSLGVFVVGSGVLHQAGGAALLCYGAAAAVGLAMAALYAELGSAFPHAGGEYALVARAIGPGAGFGILACILPGVCIGAALCAQGTGTYLATVWPGAPGGIASAAVVAATSLCLLSVRFNAWLTGSVLAVELLALAVLAALGLGHLHAGSLAPLLHPAPAAGGGSSWALLGVATASGIYAFNGYGTVVYFGEEIHEAGARLGRVVYLALGIAAIAEIVPLAAVVMGAGDFAALARSPTPIPDFVRETGGAALAHWLAAGVALALFNTLIAVVLTAARLVFATARDGAWPGAASDWLGRIGLRFGAPWVATLLVGAVALLLVNVPERVLVVIDGDGNIVLYAALALAVMLGRARGTTAGSFARMRLYPLAPVVALASLAVIAWANLQDAETGRIGMAIALGSLAAGVGYYVTVLRRKAGFALRGLEEASFSEEEEAKRLFPVGQEP